MRGVALGLALFAIIGTGTPSQAGPSEIRMTVKVLGASFAAQVEVRVTYRFRNRGRIHSKQILGDGTLLFVVDAHPENFSVSARAIQRRQVCDLREDFITPPRLVTLDFTGHCHS